MLERGRRISGAGQFIVLVDFLLCGSQQLCYDLVCDCKRILPIAELLEEVCSRNLVARDWQHQDNAESVAVSRQSHHLKLSCAQYAPASSIPCKKAEHAQQ